VIQSRRVRIFVLIDALGWEFLKGSSSFCDFLGYRVPLRTVLGFSSGAIPTILTGVPPAQNGHWNLFYLDPQGSPFRWLRALTFLPDWLLDNRIVRKLLKELGRRVLGLGGSFECCVSPKLLPWFNYVEKRNIYDRGGISGAPSIFDRLAEQGVSYRAYSYHRWKDEEICERVVDDIRGGEASFFFVYLSELDMFLHTHCSDSAALSQKLAWYDAELQKMFSVAREVDPKATFMVFSDHGMTPVLNHYDVVSEVESLKLRMPQDYLAVYDSTMARFWFFSDKGKNAIVEKLNSLSCGRIVSDEELRQLGVFFPDHRYGDIIFLMHPGSLMARSDFNGYEWKPVGMHGYHPDDPYSSGVFLSNEPRSGVHAVADIYQCMQQAASIEAR
jgi:type I phosphodiesterase/nucleotide pyrophosphatase